MFRRTKGAILMADIERLTIALPSPMADRVRAAVDAGEYASTSEVLRDALRLWEQRRDLRERDLEILRRRWDEGKASGPPATFDIDRIIRKAKGRAKSRPRG
jgi:antitoxin ParD1/3/4